MNEGLGDVLLCLSPHRDPSQNLSRSLQQYGNHNCFKSAVYLNFNFIMIDMNNTDGDGAESPPHTRQVLHSDTKDGLFPGTLAEEGLRLDSLSFFMTLG